MKYINSCKWSDYVGLAKVICKRSGHGLPSFNPHRPSFEHSRCFDNDTKGADGAADLMEVLRNSPLEKLDLHYCWQIPSTAWQKLRGASWTYLREANFRGCLVLQTWLRCLASSLDAVFFLNVKAIFTAVCLTTFGIPGASTLTQVPMRPQTCWKSCATLPWRSWTFGFALKFRPLRGSEFPVARGPRCVMHPASPRRSCQGLFLEEAQPATEVSGVGGWSLHQILLGGQVSNGKKPDCYRL